jgi:hypothetical protein
MLGMLTSFFVVITFMAQVNANEVNNSARDRIINGCLSICS